ncbi:MAG TPA: acetyl-CoA carboxylase carboxyltransferase subunit alpha, partial [Spirochaetia bacterium]|nr:acetyl-CoA carboxylase carboxyltransferase subunit alpha [Spirochaetia bacterium]
MSEGTLRDKIAELRGLAEKQNVDISRELAELEQKLREPRPAPRTTENGAWQRVELARHPERPTTLQYAERIFDDFVELHGDRAYGDDSALVGGIALLNGMPVTFFGHQKGQNMKDNLKRNFGMAHPEGYRKALRLARQAAKFGRPILSFIDTPGAYPGVSGEDRGISQAIALNMKEFAVLPVPIVATILGEGGSGGAIGIGVADIVLMMENAYYSVITPEGCASILLRDSSRAREAAALLKLTPQDLLRFRVVDRIVTEPEQGAHRDPAGAAAALKADILTSLGVLSRRSTETLLSLRNEKFLSLGVFQEEEARRKG